MSGIQNTFYFISDLARGIAKLIKGLIWLTLRLWRFGSGGELDGKARTDAGWTTPGSTVYTRTGSASRWSHLPRLHRAGYRWAGVLILVLTWYGMRSVPWLVFALYVVGGLAGATFGVMNAVRTYQRRRFDQTVVRPLYEAIAHRMGAEQYPAAQMSRLLVVPMDYQTNPNTRIVLALPSTFGTDARVQTELGRLVQNKLGVELDGHWSHVGQPYVEWTHRPQPPEAVTAADIMAQIEAAEDGEGVLGLGSRGESIAISLDSETPHVGMSIDTGGGKSSILRGLLAQYRRKGAELIICDPGGGSLPEFEGVPGVTIVTHVADIWNMIDRVQEEMERRYEERMANPAAKFRRLILTLEEGNDLYLQSVMYWEEIKQKGDKAVPPIYAKLAQLMVKARKVRIHVFVPYQYMEAKYVGGATYGPLIRSQFGMKILARYSVNVWKFLVGTTPVPRASRHPGRGVVVIGMDIRQCQFAWWTPEEARQFALGDEDASSVTSEEIIDRLRQEDPTVTDVTGRPSLYVVNGGRDDNDAGQADDDEDEGEEFDQETAEEKDEESASESGDEADDDEKDEVREGATIPAPPRRYTLAHAARERIVPLSAGALRQAKSTAKTKGWYFPAGRTTDGTTTYTARELQRWYENRQRPASGQ
jgi:hypothetical protein